MNSLKTEKDYLAAVRRAEIEFGPEHIQTGDALVQLAKFYEHCGLLQAESNCDERIHAIMEAYLNEFIDKKALNRGLFVRLR